MIFSAEMKKQGFEGVKVKGTNRSTTRVVERLMKGKPAYVGVRYSSPIKGESYLTYYLEREEDEHYPVRLNLEERVGDEGEEESYPMEYTIYEAGATTWEKYIRDLRTTVDEAFEAWMSTIWGVWRMERMRKSKGKLKTRL